MALSERLKQCLDREAIVYETVPHREAFTAREVAAASHVAERQVAKVVAVRGEGAGYLMVVLPAACRLDVAALEAAVGRHPLALVPEEEMGRLFPDCEVGAMPPFGHLYGMRLYIAVRMAYADYERLTRPVGGEFCLHEREKDLSA